LELIEVAKGKDNDSEDSGKTDGSEDEMKVDE